MVEILDYWNKIKYDSQMIEIVFRSDTFDGDNLSPKDKLHLANIINFYSSHRNECNLMEQKFGKDFLCKYVLEKVDNIWG